MKDESLYKKGFYAIMMIFPELHNHCNDQLRITYGMFPIECSLRWYILPKILMMYIEYIG